MSAFFNSAGKREEDRELLKLEYKTYEAISAFCFNIFIEMSFIFEALFLSSFFISFKVSSGSTNRNDITIFYHLFNVLYTRV